MKQKKLLAFLLIIAMVVGFIPQGRVFGAIELRITKQPKDFYFQNDTIPDVSIEAEGEGLTYQWQYKYPNGSWTNWGGATGAVFNKKYYTSYDGVMLRCIVNDNKGNSITSDEVLSILGSVLRITRQPEDFYFQNDTIPDVSIEAEGDELTYQWQYKYPSGSWLNWTGATGAVFNKKYYTSYDGVMLRCIVSDNKGNSVTSDEVLSILGPALRITRQPEDFYFQNDTIPDVSIEAEGEGLTYQWQYKYPNGSWTNWNGATGAVFNKKYYTSYDGVMLRCIVSDNKGNSVTSDEVLSILGSALRITRQPEDFYFQNDTIPDVSIEAEGDELTYQWQYKYPNGSWLNWNGATSAVFNKIYYTSYDGVMLRCIVKDSKGNSVTSDEVLSTLGAALRITRQPEDFYFQNNTIPDVSVEAEGDGLTYQWQYKYPNGSWTNWNGATSAVFNKIYYTSYDGVMLRCIVKDSKGNSMTSDEVLSTLGVALRITRQPEDFYFQNNTVPDVSIEAEGEGLTYQWQYKYPNGSWTNWNGATSAVFDKIYYESYDGVMLRCIVKDGKGNSVISDEIISYLEKEFITITFNAGDGYFYYYDSNTYTLGCESGVYYTIPTDYTMQPYRDDYVFMGWKYKGRLVSTVYVGSDITLEAVWEENSPYTITYNAGEGSFDSGSTRAESAIAGLNYLDYYNTPVRTGYKFKGWKYNGHIVRKINVTDNVVVTADWEELIPVTYVANGGYWSTDDGYEISTNVIYAPAGTYYFDMGIPENDSDLFFDYWSVNGERSYRINLTEPITVMANWYAGVQVTYDTNGGAWYWTSDIQQGTDARTGNYRVSWSRPDREGYEFLGWSNDKNATTAETDYDYNLTKDTTFYAIWYKLPVITYKANGGFFYVDIDGNRVSEYSEWAYDDYEVGSSYYPDIDIDKGYLRFIGWSRFEDTSVLHYENRQHVSFTEDTTLYAVWEKLPTITYDANGSYWEETHYGEDVQVETRINWGERNYHTYVTMGDPVWPEGYQFGGWVLEEDIDSEDFVDYRDSEIYLDRDYVFYAKWIPEHTITYDTGDGYWEENGEWIDGHEDTNGEWVEGYYTIIHVNTHTYYGIQNEYVNVGWNRPYREGFEFGGWVLEKDIDSDSYVNYDGKQICLNKDYVFYAKWIPVYTITYDAGDDGYWWLCVGSGDSWDNIQIHTCEDYVRKNRWYCVGNERPTRDGYDFRGWIGADGTNYDGKEIQVTENVTFYADWAKRVIVTYDANGGLFNGYSPYNNETESIHYREASVGEYYLAGDKPYHNNATFLGWTLDASKKDSADAPLVSNPFNLEGTATLYAVWSASYKVTFDANGGYFYKYDTESDSYVLSETPITNYVEENSDYYVGDWDRPLRDGYIFRGWSTRKDAGETEGLVNFNMRVTGNTTLYAVWEKMAEVTYSYGDWDGAPEDRTDYIEIGRYYYVSNDWPYREGYTFDGWLANGDVVLGDFVRITGDTVIEPSWVRSTTIRINLDGGVITDGYTQISYDDNGNQTIVATDPIIFSVEEGAVYSLFDMPAPIKNGYYFDGWKVNGEYVNRFVATGDEIEVVAGWIPADKLYNVTFDAGEGVFPSTGESSYTVKTGAYYWLSGSEQPSRDGYYFAGWKYPNAEYDYPITYDMIRCDVTFVAIWQKLATFNFHYDSGKLVRYDNFGNLISMNTLTTTIGRCGYGIEYPLEGMRFPESPDYYYAIEKDGDELIGWSTQPNGAGTVYNLGETIYVSDDIISMDLYAIYGPNSYNS